MTIHQTILNFPIIDSHLHLWDKKKLHYAWLNQLPALDQSFSLTELNTATHSLPVHGFVFVQAECDASEALQEVHWVTELAQEDQRVQGIVAFAPLENDFSSLYPYLETLKTNSLVKGIRRILQSETEKNFCLQANFVNAVRLLAQFNFSFDLCIREDQLPDVIDLIECCPDTTFILDHLGKPAINKKHFQPWAHHLKTLAQFPNVACKLSGLVTEANHLHWQPDDLKPYLMHAIEAFGFERILFGSDWPVVNLAANYRDWLMTLLMLCKDFSVINLQKIFFANACNYYQLPIKVNTTTYEETIA